MLNIDQLNLIKRNSNNIFEVNTNTQYLQICMIFKNVYYNIKLQDESHKITGQHEQFSRLITDKHNFQVVRNTDDYNTQSQEQTEPAARPTTKYNTSTIPAVS